MRNYKKKNMTTRFQRVAVEGAALLSLAALLNAG
jgi:hypothetical protein